MSPDKISDSFSYLKNTVLKNIRVKMFVEPFLIIKWQTMENKMETISPIHTFVNIPAQSSNHGFLMLSVCVKVAFNEIVFVYFKESGNYLCGGARGNYT